MLWNVNLSMFRFTASGLQEVCSFHATGLSQVKREGDGLLPPYTPRRRSRVPLPLMPAVCTSLLMDARVAMPELASYGEFRAQPDGPCD